MEETTRTVEPEIVHDLIVSNYQPLSFTANFEIVEAEITKELEKYNIEVNQENLQQAKKMAADLNFKSKTMETTRKEKTREFSKPIDDFESKVKRLVNLTLEAREKILSQIKKFDEKTLEICKDLMKVHLLETYEKLEVEEQYRTGDITPLIGLSQLNPGGSLKKSAKESIEGLAQQGRMAMDRVNGRIAQLENESRKAGLETPLNIEIVRPYLQETDAFYAKKLQQLIKVQVHSQEQAKKKVLEAEREKIRLEEKAKSDAKLEEERKAQQARLAEENRIAELAREEKNRKDFEERQEQVRKDNERKEQIRINEEKDLQEANQKAQAQAAKLIQPQDLKGTPLIVRTVAEVMEPSLNSLFIVDVRFQAVKPSNLDPVDFQKWIEAKTQCRAFKTFHSIQAHKVPVNG